MYQEDWLIRQISVLVQELARVLFGKKTPVYEVRDDLRREQSDVLHMELVALLREGRVNEAENLLFDRISLNDVNDLQVAVDFYDRLNGWDDAALDASGFFRGEIQEGLEEILAMYEIDGLSP